MTMDNLYETDQTASIVASMIESYIQLDKERRQMFLALLVPEMAESELRFIFQLLNEMDLKPEMNMISDKIDGARNVSDDSDPVNDYNFVDVNQYCSTLFGSGEDGEELTTTRPTQEVKARGQKNIPCDQCTKSFSHRSSLSRHKLEHKGKLFSCDYCSKRFSRSDYLQSHLIRIHKLEQSNFSQDKKTHPCDQCYRTFTSVKEVQKHKIVHAGSRRTANKTQPGQVKEKANPIKDETLQISKLSEISQSNLNVEKSKRQKLSTKASLLNTDTLVERC